MAIKYSPKVIEHFTAPQNVGDLEGADAVATEGSPACGDMVTFALKIDPVTRIIQDVRFRSFGCASNIATASMATLLAKGKRIDDIKRLTHRDIVHALDGLPSVKLHCSVLAVDGLKAAVHSWEVEQGLIRDDVVLLDIEGVGKALAGVINPRNGLGAFESNMIGRTEIEPAEGRVYIEVRITEEDERFVENLDQEIREKIELLPGVRSVVVQFKLKTADQSRNDQ